MLLSQGAGLCGKVAGMPLGRIMALLRVFAELSLVKKEKTEDGREIVALVPSDSKKDLMDSPTYRIICRSEQ